MQNVHHSAHCQCKANYHSIGHNLHQIRIKSNYLLLAFNLNSHIDLISADLSGSYDLSVASRGTTLEFIKYVSGSQAVEVGFHLGQACHRRTHCIFSSTGPGTDTIATHSDA